jgi:hypothetical protein
LYKFRLTPGSFTKLENLIFNHMSWVWLLAFSAFPLSPPGLNSACRGLSSVLSGSGCPTKHDSLQQLALLALLQQSILPSLAAHSTVGFSSVSMLVTAVTLAGGVRSVGWGRSFFVADAKLIALSRCARRSGICTISYCVPGY